MADLLIKTGTYQKDGQTKNRYTRLGVLKKNDNGHYMLIDPTVDLAGCLALQNQMADQPRSSVMVSVFTRDNNNQQQNTQSTQQPAQDDWSDDIPF